MTLAEITLQSIPINSTIIIAVAAILGVATLLRATNSIEKRISERMRGLMLERDQPIPIKTQEPVIIEEQKAFTPISDHRGLAKKVDGIEAAMREQLSKLQDTQNKMAVMLARIEEQVKLAKFTRHSPDTRPQQ